MKKEDYRYIISRYLEEAMQETLLVIFGDQLSRHYRWKNVDGKEAVALYLSKKFGWTIEYSRTLKYSDVLTASSGEFDPLVIPKHLQTVFDEASVWIEQFGLPDKEKILDQTRPKEPPNGHDERKN
jgi:hypothetical protein